MNIDAMPLTESSLRLRQTAARLIERCPVEIGQEIVLIGSAGLGSADERSDIDLDFWVQHIPAYAGVRNWLMESGVTLLGPEPDSPGEGMHLIGRCQDLWVECTWFTIAWKTKIFSDILSGEALERVQLAHAWNVTMGMPFRTQGLIGEWRQKLANYPDVLQSRLIAASTEFWLYPHHIEALWALAARGALMGLDEWLFADLQDGLRILFALNRQWEPDWKNLSLASQLLKQRPDQLMERVNRIFRSSEPNERVETTLRLLVDILSLVPPPLDVSTAKRNIEASLLSHCT